MDNRSAILACALTLFANRGYDAVGVQEVVEAAGVTKPTLYHYFGNKRGVFEALVQEGTAPLFAQLAAVTPVQGDVPETLRRIANVYLRFAQQHPELFRLLLALAYPLPNNEAYLVVEGVVMRQRQQLEDLFHTFSAHNGNLRGRESIYAWSFQALIHSFIAAAWQQNVALDGALAHRAVQQFVFGIYA